MDEFCSFFVIYINLYMILIFSPLHWPSGNFATFVVIDKCTMICVRD